MGVLRLLLALAVVIAHSAPFLGLKLTGGQIAVQAFFIISGFYMSLILNGKYTADWSGTRLFYTNRFLRIYPLYWTVLAIAIGVSALELYRPGTFHSLNVLGVFRRELPGLNWDERAFLVLTNVTLVGMDWGYFLRFDLNHLAGTSNFFEHQPHAFSFDFIPQAWTLGVEVMVYCLAPILFRRPVWALLIVVAASLTARALAFRAGLTYDPWTYRFLPFELVFFVMGSLAFKAYRALPALSDRRVGCLALAVLLGLIFNFGALPTTMTILPGLSDGQVFFLAAVAFCTPSIFALTKYSRVDRFIGELSYPVYLCHLIIIPMCNGSFGPGNSYPVVGSILLSCVLTMLVEIPLDRYRQSRVTRQVSNIGAPHNGHGRAQ